MRSPTPKPRGEAAEAADTAKLRGRRVLRLAAVKEKCGGLSTSTIYELMSRGRFPKNIHLSPRVAVWDEAELDDFLAEKRRERDGKAS